jgi:hypothetical protein
VVKLTTSIFYSPLGHSPANGGVLAQVRLPVKGEEDCPACQPKTQTSVPEEPPFLDDIEMRQVRLRKMREEAELVTLKSRSAQRVASLEAWSPDGKAKSAMDDELAMQEAAHIAADEAFLDGADKSPGALERLVHKPRRDVVRY